MTRVACACLAVAASVVLAPMAPSARAAEAAAGSRVNVADVRELKERLVELARARLEAAGMGLDGERAQLVLAVPLAAGSFDVRPLWNADAGVPALPLVFELRAAPAPEGAYGAPLRAELVAPLLRDAAVAARRLHRGAAVACEDVEVRRLPVRPAARPALALPCRIAASAVALRDVAVGDALRADDVGPPLDVIAGEPVTLHVAVGGIRVSAQALALTDARVGDLADVRLLHPSRTLKARVTGPATVEVKEANP
jgi:flagella basal body P-ring formation protein FlgA